MSQILTCNGNAYWVIFVHIKVIRNCKHLKTYVVIRNTKWTELKEWKITKGLLDWLIGCVPSRLTISVSQHEGYENSSYSFQEDEMSPKHSV